MMKRIILLMLAASIVVACKKSDTTVYSPAPKPDDGFLITDFSPKSGKLGTTITIAGKGFGTDISIVRVGFDNTYFVSPVSVTPTTITVRTDNLTPSGKISVVVGGIKVISTDDYIRQLVVDGYDSSAQLGRQMYIAGEGFGADTNKITVSFGGATPIKANYIAGDRLKIGALVPRNAQEGKITVTANGKSVTCDQIFSLDMSMRDFTPKTFSAGDVVTITGVKFTTASDMSVDFNTGTSTVIRPIKVTATEMQVIAPSNAKSGYLTISANLGTIRSTSEDKFTFK